MAEDTTRQAVLRVDRRLLEELLPDWRTALLLRYGDVLEGWMYPPEEASEWAQPFHDALKLPSTCFVTGLSTLLYFDRDQIALRIDSPDFVETVRGEHLPEVQAVYQHIRDYPFTADRVRFDGATGYFLCWAGEAVEMRRIYGLDGRVVIIGPPVARCQAVYDGLAQEEQAEVLSKLFETAKRDAIRQGVARETVRMGGFLCWRCNAPTLRRLPDGNGECQECSEKPLL